MCIPGTPYSRRAAAGLAILLAAAMAEFAPASTLSVQKARYKNATLMVAGKHRGEIPADGMVHLYDKQLGSRIASLALAEAPASQRKRNFNFLVPNLADIPCAVRVSAAGARDKSLKVRGAPKNGCSLRVLEPGPANGGNGPAGPGSPGGFPTFRGEPLSGRLVVASSNRPMLYNLATGEGQELPRTPERGPYDTETWNASADGAWLLRQDINSGLETRISLLNPTSLAPARADLAVGAEYKISIYGVAASPGADYLLGFVEYDFERTDFLTIFDGRTGQFVEQAAPELDDVVGAFPAAWLPNGDYIYLAENLLYRTAPRNPTVNPIATLDLPENRTGGGYLSGRSRLAASPDGTRIAFTWQEKRGVSTDEHIYVSNLDGTGLHRLTEVPDSSSPLDFSYGSPVWSPDGKFVAFVNYACGTVTGPSWTPDDDFTPWKVIGTTGTDASPVIVLPAESVKQVVSWPSIDRNLGVKVRADQPNTANWLTTCSSIYWIP